jgi:hypothetical protein
MRYKRYREEYLQHPSSNLWQAMRLLLYWGRIEGIETPQRMLNPGTQILPILLTRGGSKGNNRIVTSRATTTDPPRQGISTST